jgi:hypothetical protein
MALSSPLASSDVSLRIRSHHLAFFITYCYLSLLNQTQPQSLQLGQRIPICLIYPRPVSNQQQSDQ